MGIIEDLNLTHLMNYANIGFNFFFEWQRSAIVPSCSFGLLVTNLEFLASVVELEN